MTDVAMRGVISDVDGTPTLLDGAPLSDEVSVVRALPPTWA